MSHSSLGDELLLDFLPDQSPSTIIRVVKYIYKSVWVEHVGHENCEQNLFFLARGVGHRGRPDSSLATGKKVVGSALSSDDRVSEAM